MRIISEHVLKYLKDFIESPEEDFETIFSKIQNPTKIINKPLLIYLDKLLNRCINLNQEQLKYTHLHFEDITDDQILIMGEFIIIKFFHLAYKLDNSDSENQDLIAELDRLSTIISHPIYFPANSKKHEESNIRAERKGLRSMHSFYKNIELLKTFAPNAIINLQLNNFKKLLERFKYDPYATPVNTDNLALSYVLMNIESIESLRNKKINNVSILKLVKNIVLFDCESRTSIFQGYNFGSLNNLNLHHGTNFKNLLIVSFNNNGFKFSKLYNRLERIHSRFINQQNLPRNQNFMVIPAESKFLTDKTSVDLQKIGFFGVESVHFWDDFKICTQAFEDLYELRSIKLMNIYSLSFNEQIKDYIISDIFSSEQPAKLITGNTWDTIQELSQDSIDELKGYLSSTLDFIIQSSWLTYLKNKIQDLTTILCTDLISNNQFLLREISNSLSLTKKNKIVNWFTVDFETDTELILLDYRDVGQFPYLLSPNIFENKFNNSRDVNGIYLNIFFKSLYDWTNYNLGKDFYKILDHPVRRKFFAWSELSQTVQRIKPDSQFANFDLENKYYSSRSRNNIRIKFKNSRKSIVFNPSEQFIIKPHNSDGYRVKRIDEIAESILPDTIFDIQQLDELYSGFNLYNEIANIQREEEELQIIRKSFEIEETEPGRLWKILLNRKAISGNLQLLYDDLARYFKKKNLSLVSLNHFEHNWTNPNSTSLIPRGKRIFYELCQYLGLPKSYLRIMLRLKNAEIQSARNSSKQMNELLADMINDGCFDDTKELSNILTTQKNIYLKKHDFDEIGIGEDQFIVELSSLVDLLKPNFKLKELEIIEIESL